MYSIIELCDKGYKVRWATKNLEEIYKYYLKLSSVDEIRTKKKKFIILDYKKKDIISLEQLKSLFEKKIINNYEHTLNVKILFIVLIILYLLFKYLILII
jgi:hypothetical protein